MADYTENYNLKKPSPEDFVDIVDINGNMDKIDEALQVCKDASGACYCVCNTAAATREKVATVIRGNFKLEAGVAVDVKFSEDNKIVMPSLNVNGTGAKSIKMYSIIGAESYMWQAGAVVRFVYDGQYWLMQNGTTASTTYYGVTKLSSSTSSTSTTMAATPSAVKQAYDLANQKADKVANPTEGSFVSMDSDGNLVNSDYYPDDFTLVGHGHSVATTTKNGFMSKEQVAALNEKPSRDEMETIIVTKATEIAVDTNTILFDNVTTTDSVKKHGSPSGLTQGRYGLAATTVGNYALFAGGATDINKDSDVTNAYSASLTRSTPTALSAARYSLAAATISNYAVFAGGRLGLDTSSAVVDAYNSSLTGSIPTALSQSRYRLAATTVGSYALFGGGSGTNTIYADSAVVESYNSSLTRTVRTALSEARGDLAATTIGNYALFAGGSNSTAVDAYNSSLTRSTPVPLSSSNSISNLGATVVGNYALFGARTVEAYDSSLTKSSVAALSQARTDLSAVSLECYAVFAGGKYGSTYYTNVDTYNSSLTRATASPLSTEKCGLAAATVGIYAVFAGGYKTSNMTPLSTVDAYESVMAEITIPPYSKYNFAGVTNGEEQTIKGKNIVSGKPLTGYIKKITELSGRIAAN